MHTLPHTGELSSKGEMTLFPSHKLSLSFEQVKKFSSFLSKEETCGPNSHYRSLAVLITSKMQREFHGKFCYSQTKF